jgi:hypothetical protein
MHPKKSNFPVWFVLLYYPEDKFTIVFFRLGKRLDKKPSPGRTRGFPKPGFGIWAHGPSPSGPGPTGLSAPIPQPLRGFRYFRSYPLRCPKPPSMAVLGCKFFASQKTYETVTADLRAGPRKTPEMPRRSLGLCPKLRKPKRPGVLVPLARKKRRRTTTKLHGETRSPSRISRVCP